MKFEYVQYRDYVGNITIENDRMVFETDKKSVNPSELKLEILFTDINRQKTKKHFTENNFMQNIVIETKNNKYEFRFRYIDEYDKFLEFMKDLLFGE